MKNKKFFLLVAAFIFFAVITAGGCGGSGDTVAIPNSTNGNGGTSAELNLPSMFDIRLTPEFSAMLQELKADGVMDKIEKLTIHHITDTASINEQIISSYNSGNVLIMYHPTEADLAKVLSLLRSASSDISMVSIASHDVEVCAITKRTASGPVINQDNTVKLNSVFVYVVPDISTLVSVDTDYSPDDVEQEYLDLQVARWKRYYCWLASLDDQTAANAEVASAITAAAASEDNNIVKISSVLTGTYDWSYSNSKSWDNATMDKVQMTASDISRTVYAGSRTNVVDYRVYSVHSFTDHCDYFLVESNLSTKPLKVEESNNCIVPLTYGSNPYSQPERHYDGFPGVRGYTRELNTGVSLGEILKVSMPDGVTNGTKYTEHFTWSEDGSFDAHDFGIFKGVSYSGDIEFDATNISIQNLSDKSAASIKATFDYPDDSSMYPALKDVKPASSNECRLPAFTVLKVASDDWRKAYDAIKLVFQGGVTEDQYTTVSFWGKTTGNVYQGPVHLNVTKNFKLEITNPNPPKHATVHQKYYACNRHEGRFGVKIYSESDWKIVMLDPGAESWVTFEKTSGQATGPEGEWVIFTCPENTSGSQRFAHFSLQVTPYEDKTIIEATPFELFQSITENSYAE